MTSQTLADKVAAATFAFEVLAAAADEAESLMEATTNFGPSFVPTPEWESWCAKDAMADAAYRDLSRLEHKVWKASRKASRRSSR